MEKSTRDTSDPTFFGGLIDWRPKCVTAEPSVNPRMSISYGCSLWTDEHKLCNYYVSMSLIVVAMSGMSWIQKSTRRLGLRLSNS